MEKRVSISKWTLPKRINLFTDYSACLRQAGNLLSLIEISKNGDQKTAEGYQQSYYPYEDHDDFISSHQHHLPSYFSDYPVYAQGVFPFCHRYSPKIILTHRTYTFNKLYPNLLLKTSKNLSVSIFSHIYFDFCLRIYQSVYILYINGQRKKAAISDDLLYHVYYKII